MDKFNADSETKVTYISFNYIRTYSIEVNATTSISCCLGGRRQLTPSIIAL